MRWWWFGIIAVVLGFGFSLAKAQGSTPIIFLRGGDQAALGYGDLWSWTPGAGEPFRETTWGYNTTIVQSPDGSRIAYLSLPEAFVNMLAAGEYTFNPDQQDPANIWVMDIASRQFTRIADQGVPAEPYRGVYRTRPTWSPDGHKIAWGELDPDPNVYAGQVAVYDLASGETILWAKRLGMAFADGGFFWPTGLSGWGSLISRQYWTFGLPGGYQDPGTLLEFVGENGVVRQETLAVDGFGDASGYPPGPKSNRWVLHQDKWYMALEYDFGWQLMDAASGERLTLFNPPSLQIPGGAGLHLRRLSDDWEILTPSGRIVRLGYNAEDVTFSPDGQAVVYLRDGQPYIWREDQPTVPLLPESARDWNVLAVQWTPSIWVTDGQASPMGIATPIPTIAPPTQQG